MQKVYGTARRARKETINAGAIRIKAGTIRVNDFVSTIRIRVCLQAYRNYSIFNRAFRRCHCS